MPAADDIYTESRGAGQPIVFIHGAWVSRQMWAPQLAAFADDYRVIAPDLRGHGRTGRPDGGELTVGRFVEDVRVVIERLDVDTPVLCGLSLGGLVAQQYALEYPDDLRGLVLADTVRSVPPVPFPRTTLGKRVVFPTAAMHSLVHTMGVMPVYRLLVEGIEAVSGRPWFVRDRVRRYVMGEVARFDPTSFLRVLDAMYAFEPSAVGALDVPIAIVLGDHEAPTVAAQNRALARRIEGADLAVVSDAGHLSNLDNPAAFNRTVSDFLDDTG